MPHFKVEQNEDPNRTWIWISTNYFDATGNMHKSFLCPHEPALLMKVQLESRAFAGFDTNGLWTTSEIKVPAPGTFTLVPESATLGGVTIWTGMLAGPGVVTYSNGVPIKAIEDSTELPHLLVTPMDVGVGGANYASSKSSCWILGIGISGLKHMHDLIIFAIDDQGEKTKAGDFIKQPGGLVFSESLDSRGRPRGYIEAVNTYKSAKFITLPLNKKAKTIRLSMGIHYCRKVGMEFLFKPAGSVQMMSEKTDDQSNTKIYGQPIKEFRHVCACYFMQSLAKDTYEGQKIAKDLINNGYGVEYIGFIYNDSLGLGKRLDELYQSRKYFGATRNEIAQSADYKKRKETIIDDYVEGKRFKIAPLNNPELLNQLLELHPKKQYETYSFQEVKAAGTPENRWLSGKDVLDYIQKHPVQSKP